MPEPGLERARVWQLRLPFFEGRLSDLVRLVVDRRVSVSELRTADIARQVSDHLVERPVTDLEEVGELAVDVARILLLKSAFLLARPQEAEHEEGATADVPQVDRGAILRLAFDLRTREGSESFAPDWRACAIERPIGVRNPEVLTRMWQLMEARRTPELAPVAVPAFVRLEIALSTVLRRVKRSTRLSLRSIIGNAGRNDVVIYFLAVLELTRRRQLVPIQNETFGDISLQYDERIADTATHAG